MKQCGVKKKTSSTFRTFVFVYFYFYFWAGRWAYSETLLESLGILFFGTLNWKKVLVEVSSLPNKTIRFRFFLNACCVSRLIKRTESYH